MREHEHSVWINPGRVLLPKLERRLFRTRKGVPIWAVQVDRSVEVASLEGPQHAQPEDFPCRGVRGELWPQ